MGVLQQLFTTSLALKVTGASRSNLDKWVTTGLLTPTQAAGGKGRRGHRWTFRDLVEIRAIVELRQAGISLQALSKVATFLQSYGGDFASTYLVVAGGDVLLASGDTLISTLKAPGQLSYAIVYDLERADRDVREALAA